MNEKVRKIWLGELMEMARQERLAPLVHTRGVRKPTLTLETQALLMAKMMAGKAGNNVGLG